MSSSILLLTRWLQKVLVFNWNHFEMRLLNLRINFYLLRTFCPHLCSFCVVSSFTTFRPNFTSGLLQVILPRPRIGMLSLVTVSPVITAFHSCCLSHKKINSLITKRRETLSGEKSICIIFNACQFLLTDTNYYIYIYICVCVCVCVCVHDSIGIYVFKCACVYMYLCMRALMWVYSMVCEHVCVSEKVCVCVCVCVCVYKCVYVLAYVFACAHVNGCMCIRAYMHLHMCTCVRVHVFGCVRVSVCLRAWVWSCLSCLRALVCECLCVCMKVRVSVYKCVYIFINEYVYACMCMIVYMSVCVYVFKKVIAWLKSSMCKIFIIHMIQLNKV